MIPEVLLLVEQICSATAQIDNLRTAISVFLQSRAREAVEGITDAFATADDTFVLVIAKSTFVAYTDCGGGPDVGIAYWTLAIAFVA